jgi:hypothetical protein
MVGINVQCRLGNQLFQYAFIKALAERFDTSFYLNEKIEPLITADYFDLEGYSPTRNMINKFLLKIQSGNLIKKLRATDVDTYSEATCNSLTNHTIYNGYFQSELFFKDIAAKIPAYIRVKKEHIAKFQNEYNNIFTNNRTIAVHIRRGDYLNLDNWWAENFGSNNLSLPTSYYLKCLEQVPDHKNCKIIFVSDDIDFVRTEFAHISNSEFSQSDMITDFQIIMNADVCILSNSSFAWWAAFLNPKKNKLVYCPQYWLGFKVKKEYPENIIPAGWNQVTVEPAIEAKIAE